MKMSFLVRDPPLLRMCLHVVWGDRSAEALSYQLFPANRDGERGMAAERGMASWVLSSRTELVSRK